MIPPAARWIAIESPSSPSCRRCPGIDVTLGAPQRGRGRGEHCELVNGALTTATSPGFRRWRERWLGDEAEGRSSSLALAAFHRRLSIESNTGARCPILQRLCMVRHRGRQELLLHDPRTVSGVKFRRLPFGASRTRHIARLKRCRRQHHLTTCGSDSTQTPAAAVAQGHRCPS
jgi:hypothetical protein